MSHVRVVSVGNHVINCDCIIRVSSISGSNHLLKIYFHKSENLLLSLKSQEELESVMSILMRGMGG